MATRVVHLIRWVLLILTPAGVFGCSQSEPEEKPPPPEFEVSLPVVRTIVDYKEFTGRLDAIDSVQVKARVSGYLKKIRFKDGDEVKEGDTLFEIDPRPYRAQLEQDKADLVNKQAVLKEKKAIYDRGSVLLQTRAIAQEEYEIQKADYQVARAGVGQAEAKLKISQLNMEWTQVKAPISGRLSRTLITRGNLVTADNTLLTTIVTLDPLYLYFTVDERTLLRLRETASSGSAAPHAHSTIVELGLANEEGYAHKGTLDFEDNRVDPATGTIVMRGVFPNPKASSGARLLSPGLFARVRLTVGTPRQGILVADRALGTDQGKKFLYVVQARTDDKTGAVKQVVERRYVQTGDLHGGLREIKTETRNGALPGKQTITAKEQVVVSGLQRLRPGTEVAPKVIEMPVGTDRQTPKNGKKGRT